MLYVVVKCVKVLLKLGAYSQGLGSRKTLIANKLDYLGLANRPVPA